jgi:hypothetical protein
MAYINITKGWPSITAVDLSLPVHADHTDIVTGMAIHNVGGYWKKGVAAGYIATITAPQQSPTSLDVYRRTTSTFANTVYPDGVGEMGAGKMGGITLATPMRFETDQYSALVGGEVVYSPTTTANAGKFIQCTDATTQQIVGQCVQVVAAQTNGLPAVADIIGMPALLLP